MARGALPAPEIPQSLEELSPEWLTSVLRARGILTGSRVVSRETEILGEGEGFVGQIVRLSLDLDRPEPGAPASLIAKLPIGLGQNRQLGEAIGAYDREIRFYNDLAEQVPIPKPICYHAVMDPNPMAGREDAILSFFDRLPRWLVRLLVPFGMWLATKSTRRYLLLLEDLAPGRRLGNQVEGCSPEEAESILRQIATVHAAWWERPELASLGWAPRVNILSRYAEVLFRKASVGFIERFGPSLSPEFVGFVDWLGTGGTPVMKSLDGSPTTLVHGDYRLDNLFLSGEGADAKVTAFDWQTVARGPGVLDAAYFVSGNLTPETAVACEMDLLAAYHAQLVAEGVQGYDFEACLRDYRLSMLFVAYRLVAGIDLIDFSNERGVELIRGWVARTDALLPRDYRELVQNA
jgi:hypothetical protein